MELEGSCIVVGGGLAGSLIALARAEAGRARGLVLLEQGGALGGNHTWSFHRADLGAEAWGLVSPLVAHRWPRHEVRFPGHTRTIESEYASVTSERFARVVGACLRAAGARVLKDTRAVSVRADRVGLEDGTELRAPLVLDARGPERGPVLARAGYQKFVGLELDLAEDGPWEIPVVIDAERDVEQLDGFRFLYVLPFSRRCVLVEDTTYSDSPALDAGAVEERSLAYARARGARVRRVLRRETGVLPLPLRTTPPPASDAGAPLRVGYRGGFFHPVTGYSLPLAARVALAVAASDTRSDALTTLQRLGADLEREQGFGRLLNRLLFDAMSPALRWTALVRFYRLPAETIGRFYASRTTLWDRARVLAGRPPRGISWRRLLASSAEGA